jgi:hypothetical protein
MPKLFSTLIAIVIGYLDGAGLGAVSYGFIARLGADQDARIALVAALAAGPLGALLGLLFARMRLAPETSDCAR